MVIVHLLRTMGDVGLFGANNGQFLVVDNISKVVHRHANLDFHQCGAP